MKKNALLLLLPLSFFMTANAKVSEKSAEEPSCPNEMNFYAKVLGGANFLQNTTTDGNNASYEPGYVFAGSLGYSWQHYGLSLEGEYAYRRNAIKKMQFFSQGDSDQGHFQTSSYMANLVWTMPLCSWGCKFLNILPFVGGGLGYDFEQIHASNSRVVFHQKWDHFSWQVMTGLVFPLFRYADITLEYKFHQGGHFDNHSVGVGFVYKFGFLK